jgi:phenylacetate-CoA ligase
VIRPIQYAKGWLSALVAYPMAERIEKRDVRSKRKELRQYYKLDFAQRKRIMEERLVKIVQFAGVHVPYYKDLFQAQAFDPEKLRQDPRHCAGAG